MSVSSLFTSVERTFISRTGSGRPSVTCAKNPDSGTERRLIAPETHVVISVFCSPTGVGSSVQGRWRVCPTRFPSDVSFKSPSTRETWPLISSLSTLISLHGSTQEAVGLVPLEEVHLWSRTRIGLDRMLDLSRVRWTDLRNYRVRCGRSTPDVPFLQVESLETEDLFLHPREDGLGRLKLSRWAVWRDQGRDTVWVPSTVLCLYLF